MGVLTEITRDKHREAEATEFVQYMFTGRISKEHYVEYLEQMYHVYDTLETYGVNLFSGMEDLFRTAYIKQDIEELNGKAFDGKTIYPSTEKYKQHLIALSEFNPSLLLAHIYVRHMGDLYGGKIIRKKIPGEGRAYHFEQRPEMIKELNSRLTLELSEEALKGFDFCIDIFKELANRQNYAAL